MNKKPAIEIAIDPAPKRELKALGGGDRDQWNERLVGLVTKALPVNHPTRSKSVAVVLEFSAKGGNAGGDKCDHCGEFGETLECHYGLATAWLHRECQDDWRRECDQRGDGLDIPGFLDR